MPRGISKACDGSGTVRHQDVRARESSAGGPHRDDDVASLWTCDKGGRRVVTSPGSENNRAVLPRALCRPEDSGNPHDAAQRALKQVEPVFIGDGRPVARPTRVAAIGCERLDRQAVVVLRTEESPGEPVMRKTDSRRATGILEFVLGEPSKFRDGE